MDLLVIVLCYIINISAISWRLHYTNWSYKEKEAQLCRPVRLTNKKRMLCYRKLKGQWAWSTFFDVPMYDSATQQIWIVLAQRILTEVTL